LVGVLPIADQRRTAEMSDLARALADAMETSLRANDHETSESEEFSLGA
jgi:hypothetical protein